MDLFLKRNSFIRIKHIIYIYKSVCIIMDDISLVTQENNIEYK